MTSQEATTVQLVLELGVEDARRAALLCGLLNTSCTTHQFQVVGMTALWVIEVSPRPTTEEV